MTFILQCSQAFFSPNINESYWAMEKKTKEKKIQCYFSSLSALFYLSSHK